MGLLDSFVYYYRRVYTTQTRACIEGSEDASVRGRQVANLLWGTEEEEVGYVYCSYIYAEVCGNGRAIYVWIVYTL